MADPFQVLPFAPEIHGGFVYGTFREHSGTRAGVLRGLLMRDGAKLLVAASPDDPDSLIAWIATAPGNRIVYAYTKYLFRKMSIGSSLAIAAGIDFEKPVECIFWSRAATRIASKSGNPYRIVPMARREMR